MRTLLATLSTVALLVFGIAGCSALGVPDTTPCAEEDDSPEAVAMCYFDAGDTGTSFFKFTNPDGSVAFEYVNG